MKINIGYFYLIVFYLTIGQSCRNASHEDAGLTTIEGRIQFPAGNKIYLYSYPDSLSLFLNQMVAIDSSLIDEKGDYKMNPEINFPVDCYLQMGDSLLVPNLFLSRGYHIKLDFNGKNLKPEYDLHNPEGKYNDYLEKLVDRFYRDPETKTFYYISTNYLDIHTFSHYIDERRQQEAVFYQNYFKNTNVDRAFSIFALNQIAYQFGVDKLMWRWKKRMKSEHVDQDTTYYDFLTPSFIHNDYAINCPSYIRFLNLYIKDVYERLVEEKLATHSLTNEPVAVGKYKLIMQNLEGIQRDIALYNLIFDDMDGRAKNTMLASLRELKRQGGIPEFPDSLLLSFKNKYTIK